MGPSEGVFTRLEPDLLPVDRASQDSYVASMTKSSGDANDAPVHGCAELHAEVDARCTEAHETKAAHEQVSERIRELRRDLVAAQHKHSETLGAADPSLREAEKAAARDSYRLARTTATDDDEQREATAAWAHSVDRINRSSRLADREVSRAKATVEATEAALRDAEREDQTARLRADQAEAACLDARVRLAACEEGASAAQEDNQASVFEPHAATGGHAVAVTEAGQGPPLVIESMVSGDRLALELAAAHIAENTGLSPAEVQLQLQELVDAIISAASEDGFLAFDTSHPFWSGLTFEEARDVVAALARLGFIFEPSEGWHAGRAPAPSDLSMALAYAGLDARNMRDLPSVDDLLELPRSIGVDARAFLAAQAPDLTIDHVVPMLGRRADQLEPLWNEWGQVRPVLLSDRHALGSVPG